MLLPNIKIIRNRYYTKQILWRKEILLQTLRQFKSILSYKKLFNIMM